jgi:hypothetical protein
MAAAALVVTYVFVAAAERPKSLGERVVAFCKEHRGKRVGNGECTTLAVAALQAAGAETHGPIESSRNVDEPRDNFNWGERIFTVERDGTNPKTKGQFRDVRPGDIIQYQDVELAGVTDIGTYTARSRRHTAIVFGVDKEEIVLKLYHQNYNGRKAVTTDRLRLADLQHGRLSIFHPIQRARRQPNDRAPLGLQPETQGEP